ncbi:TRAPP trafficking subunit Trs65-domain-containing protein [Lactarius hengduanensis]|nr:TRAPP trafficking subunit Trs65-domain-containing protein [Lactarius hengduanensis]
MYPTPRTLPLPSYPSLLAPKSLTTLHTYPPPTPPPLLNPPLDSALRHALSLSSQPQGMALSIPGPPIRTWGEPSDPAKARLVEDRDAFALLWDETAGVWVAIYRMSINVAFLRLPSRDPLLCLTASITVREKPVLMTPARSAARRNAPRSGRTPQIPGIRKRGSRSPGAQEYPIRPPLRPQHTHRAQRRASRTLPSPCPAPGSAPRHASKILLFRPLRGTLSIYPPRRQPSPPAPRSANRFVALFPSSLASACACVPCLSLIYCLTITHPDAALDDALAAGHAERTVMLCVELEHPGQAPEGFSVEAVDVTVGGAGGARVRLLPGDGKSPPELFPLRLGAYEQYNLLFAVELLSSPISEKEALLLGMSASALGEELQRPVTITVRGQPFSNSLSEGNDAGARVVGGTEESLFPTQPFPSRWNCVLDLAPQRSPAVGQTDSEVLPEPPTPFPTPTQRISLPTPDKQPAPNLVAGSKRFTAPSMPVPRSPRSILALPRFYRRTRSRRRRHSQQQRAVEPEPALQVRIHAPERRSGALVGRRTAHDMLPMAEADEAFVNGGGGTTPPPATPAYPAYPKGSPGPSTPRVQGPLAAWGAASVPGAPVETPRGGALAPLLSRARVQSLPSPAPPLPLASASAVPERERVVVSVGMHGGADGGARRLVPHDEFALDVFVFNQSAWTRRFEVSVWERRRRRQGLGLGGVGAGPGAGPGIVPLESRVRVGPLRPATCQSVRMSFLALAPGVHTIEALTLTDVETQHALTLRLAGAPPQSHSSYTRPGHQASVLNGTWMLNALRKFVYDHECDINVIPP